MGNIHSTGAAIERAGVSTSESGNMTMDDPHAAPVEDDEFHDTIDEEEARAKNKEAEMVEFKKQLDIKREQRKGILARHRSEKEELQQKLENEIKSKLELHERNRILRELLDKNNIKIPDDLQCSTEYSDFNNIIVNMRDELENIKSHNNKLRIDLTIANSALQGAYSDMADLHSQNLQSINQINALKEVVRVSKTMVNLREEQLNELKNKLTEIEQSLADREANMLSASLRQEYERQLQNIRTLRGLYEERARLAEVTRQSLARELEDQKVLYQIEITKCVDLTAKVLELETRVADLEETIESKNSQIFTCQDETQGIKAEMGAVNKLFSQVLLGNQTKQDLDKLVHRLEENHGLLTHMAERENGSEASSALPKLLLELVSQVDEMQDSTETKSQGIGSCDVINHVTEATDNQTTHNTTPEEIVQNLPKVWRVLIELLSHQSVEPDNSEKVTTCYKSVDTKSGPVLVPSVSQTYIRLKDLIVEKLALNREVNRMKQLNSHLETRLGEQEKRLCLVSTELSKTWHVVGRLRRHHHQLHTHEKILKYELQQKRKLLNELKEELEFCREKWEQAREKNTQSERDWKTLQAEFTSRKSKPTSFNTSAESGYSDERPSDESSESNDDSEYVTEPLIRNRKKNKKSFETILDSSTDFNLVAEREDPASDLLDVTDLPLDTQEGDDSHEACVSDSYNSESIVKSDKLFDETEDEIGEFSNEPCDEDVTEITCLVGIQENNSSQEGSSNSVRESVKILMSLKEQDNQLALKDQNSENLECSTESLVNTRTTAKTSEQIEETLKHLNVNRPSSSKLGHGVSMNSQNPEYHDCSNDSNKKKSKSELNEIKTTSDYTTTQSSISKENSSNIKKNYSDTTEPTVSDPSTQLNQSNKTAVVDFKAILANVKQQDKRLAKKDERLENMESGCSQILSKISSTIETAHGMMNKLDTLHRKHDDDKSMSSDSSNDFVCDEPDGSGTSEIDHKARFAARDIRLKRLEEQTKSLVSKVNKTKTKGVKIHYKLQELHNIYGSENSRAGTPSEDTEDKSQDSDDSQDESN